jgi:hypothetical protein
MAIIDGGVSRGAMGLLIGRPQRPGPGYLLCLALSRRC